MNALKELALVSNAWPFQEAKAILDKLQGKAPEKGYVLFETGYGPSGLPHIGTFGEVARTSMVRHAFETLSDIPTKLFAFSDDMDGLRKVPDNIPNQEMVRQHLGKPLTAIPDPYGTHESYGHHMNARLRDFLDRFGFDYEFKSATDYYKNGKFDEALLKVLRHYDKIMAIMLPTLGEERQATYSPFLPVCPETGIVLQVPVLAHNVERGTMTYKAPDGSERETPVTGGHCKLQWKADWAMRWTALEVDYEMHGKDLIPTAELSTKICRTMGGVPPILFRYELFLDDKGQKISKSKGNGLTMDEWLRYAPTESLSLYMYQSPTKAKRLYFDVIPRAVDEYLTFLEKYTSEDEAKRLANPVWHIHHGNPPAPELSSISFTLLLNLASACNPEDKSVLWGFISRYAPGHTPENAPFLDQLAGYAVQYYHDFVKPAKEYRTPTHDEVAMLKRLAATLEALPKDATAEILQNALYDLSKQLDISDLREFFKSLYEMLLGQSQGPRLGSFIALYGINETKALINSAIQNVTARAS
jgi:lysyl-tRNA synthetase class 1